jgi:Domain of unknown function (DUF4823)
LVLTSNVGRQTTSYAVHFLTTLEAVSMFRFFHLTPVALLAACVSAYVPEPLPPPSANAKLQRSNPVLIATPENGSYEEEKYPESGAQTAAVIKAAFARFAGTVEISPKCRTVECLHTEAKDRFTYYVVPEILHWEDRNTERSAKPDRVVIKITVFNAANLAEVDSLKIEQSAAWAILGGMHPELLLPQPAHQHVARLY